MGSASNFFSSGSRVDETIISVDSVSALESLSGVAPETVFLDAGGRSGFFKWDDSDLSTEVSNDPGKGVYVPLKSSPSGSAGAWVRTISQGDRIDASWFGVVADGATVADTALSNFVTFLGMDLREGQLPVGDILISDTWNINKRVTIYGHGKLEVTPGSGTVVATRLLKNGNFTAVKLSASLSSLRSCVVDGQDNSGSGIQILGGRCGLEHVTSLRHGGIGIIVGDPDNAGGNYNQWYFREVITRDNGSHGVLLDDASVSPNVNGGVAYGLKTQDNSGDGIRVANSAVNTFIGFYAETNSGSGIHCVTGARYATFVNAGSEGNSVQQALFDSGTSNNLIFGAHNFDTTDNGANSVFRATGGSNQYVHLNQTLKMGTKDFRSTDVSNGLTVESNVPGITLYEADGGTNEKQWELLSSGGTLSLRAVEDDGTNPVTALTARRNGTNVFEVRIVNSTFKVDEGVGVYGTTPPSQQGPLTTVDSSSVNSGDATTDTVINNMRTRINELEAALQAYGLLA